MADLPVGNRLVGKEQQQQFPVFWFQFRQALLQSAVAFIPEQVVIDVDGIGDLEVRSLQRVDQPGAAIRQHHPQSLAFRRHEEPPGQGPRFAEILQLLKQPHPDELPTTSAS